jgi:hypothetical protein
LEKGGVECQTVVEHLEKQIRKRKFHVRQKTRKKKDL